MIVVSAVGSIVGIVYLIIPQPIVCLGVAAGFGWALAIALFVINGANRARIAQLEGDLADARLQADTWSSSAADASAASRAIAELFRPQTAPPVPRTKRVARKPKDEGQ